MNTFNPSIRVLTNIKLHPKSNQRMNAAWVLCPQCHQFSQSIELTVKVPVTFPPAGEFIAIGLFSQYLVFNAVLPSTLLWKLETSI